MTHAEVVFFLILTTSAALFPHLTRCFHSHFIYIAPYPSFTRLERLDKRVVGAVEMFGSMLIFGGVAAADVAADETDAQMNPAIAHLQALLAAIGAGRNSLIDLFYVATFH